MHESCRNASDDTAFDFSGAVTPGDQPVRRLRIEPPGGDDRIGAALGRKIAVDVAPFSLCRETDRHRSLADAETFDRDHFELFVIRPRAEFAIKPRARTRLFRLERLVAKAACRADVNCRAPVCHAGTAAACCRATRCHAYPTASPSSAHKTALTTRDVDANCAASSAGAVLLKFGGFGAPMRCGNTINAMASIFAVVYSRRAKTKIPAAVESAVATHQTCRESSGAAALPGSSGERPSAGASEVAAKAAIPHKKAVRGAIGTPAATIAAMRISA